MNMITNKNNINRKVMVLLPLFAAAVVAGCWVVGCAKKSGWKAVPEISDTLSETPTTLTDKRDGKIYKTTTVGKQTWMAKNLNYATDSGSWCYNDSLSYCKQYGRLYDWNTATTVCPSGWHLPSREEWDVLAEFVGGSKVESEWPDGHHWYDAGTKLKSTSGWYDLDGNNNGNGTDAYGFSALPGGVRYSDGSFDDVGGYWWTASKIPDRYAYVRYMISNSVILYEGIGGKGNGFSVRCVKDADGPHSPSLQKSVSMDKSKNNVNRQIRTLTLLTAVIAAIVVA